MNILQFTAVFLRLQCCDITHVRVLACDDAELVFSGGREEMSGGVRALDIACHAGSAFRTPYLVCDDIGFVYRGGDALCLANSAGYRHGWCAVTFGVRFFSYNRFIRVITFKNIKCIRRIVCSFNSKQTCYNNSDKGYKFFHLLE